MQFVPNGPDIPNALLQSHEEGRVVFFCGAGISYPAGLPGFKGLVDEIYARVGTPRMDIEQKAYDSGQFDATLDLLERRLPGQRIEVRKALAQALQPNWRRKGATDTHAALLQLARCREGSIRLVTTNFDRVFERAARRTKLHFNSYAAPMLPIPKSSRWDGLVYLHGLLPNKVNDSDLHRLILTSGDFGLAYLTERWAARFVSELFRNYVVCFVGYSINDPVLRYMMDALAADRMLGEITPQAYALGDFEPGQEEAKTVEWKAKGVAPVLYEVSKGSNDHSALHSTLATWAATYRDGMLGKERIVEEYALTRPSASTTQDDFVGRMLWAISHHSGLPAKRFAEFNPVPAIEWLEAFSMDRFLHSDLNRFNVPPQAAVDDELTFSLISRPAPYAHAPRMSLLAVGATSSRWDDAMNHLARWLVRHLNNPVLIIWLAQRGSHLHDQWPWLIEQELNRFALLEKTGQTVELEEIRKNAPNAIPGRLMQVLWRMLLTNRVKSPRRSSNLYQWEGRLKRDGLTTTLRLELRELLSPKITLKKPFRRPIATESECEPTRIKQLVDWELVLAADDVRSSLTDLNNESWRTSLPALLDDFQQLLRDALDLMQELSEVDEHSDRSYWDLPSISPHQQNQGFRDWVTLIELLRDAWLATLTSDLQRAQKIALAWFDLPYSTFKRLALFAASHDGCVGPEQWCEWLVLDGARWLWAVDTRRETMRLLVLQAPNLKPSSRSKLEAAILAGPPRDRYHDDIEANRWQQLVDHSIWLHLAKLSKGSDQLGDAAARRMEELSTANPDWRLASNERDEFSHWMSGTGDPDFEASRDIDIAPRRRKELVDWLKLPAPEKRPLYEDTWRETCRTRFFHSFLALCDLAQEGIWPPVRWREALQAWSEEGKVRRSWRFAAPLIQRMPDSVLLENIHGVTWWMEAASKSITHQPSILLELCQRVLTLPLEPNTGIRQDGKPIKQPVIEAINHPIGHTTQALINLWFKQEPADNATLPADIELSFNQLCDINIERFRHGRVLLAANLIALFRVDRSWTETHLLPLFDWGRSSVEAKGAWEGFLWSPRLHRPLMLAFRSQFLSTAHHYQELGDHKNQFSAFLTHAALEPFEGYVPKDFQTAIGALPQDGLSQVARTLSQALESAGDQREEYWRNRVQPFWHRIWPKSLDLASNQTGESLARLCVAAGDEFPKALSQVMHWLKPIEHSHYLVNLLHKSGLCSRFPEDALRLLDATLKAQAWLPAELGLCLEAISKAMPRLQKDPRHRQLIEYVQQRGR